MDDLTLDSAISSAEKHAKEINAQRQAAFAHAAEAGITVTPAQHPLMIAAIIKAIKETGSVPDAALDHVSAVALSAALVAASGY